MAGRLPALERLELNGSLVQLGTAKDVFYEDAQSDDFEISVTWNEGASARFVLEYHREDDVSENPFRIDRPRRIHAHPVY